ncbi:hypothetical protein ZIOFF_039064 [Zingiber officinale]|uniref:C2H2-type domain-containing protein n=1 Tax=Zingiber officinale TaxID=94328 RepID=A0A8J5GFG8_ZINOF|nr:hypothetical protein ZIOFF_039064 [Zingiber officinale]
MADVIDMPSEAPDRRRSLQPDQRESPAAGSLSPPPPPPRKRDRDSKGERDDRPSGMRDDHRDSRDRSPIPPLPPPPPIPLPKDDKNQEYRRRNSPSSPPYRDRRHSPPRRSPPPGTFKRARRDDGGYDRRRGSPRGGYGPDERRGYDRGGSGGRGWYGDERLHARHGNRPSDWPDSRHVNYGGDSANIQSQLRARQFKLTGQAGHGASLTWRRYGIMSSLSSESDSADKSLGDLQGDYNYRGLYHCQGMKPRQKGPTLGVDNKTNDGSNSSGFWWEESLIHSASKTRRSGSLEILTAKDKIDAAATEALDPVVRKIRDEKYGWKYGCGAKGCTKLFHAPEFVHKHLKLKHPDLVIELTSKVREDLYIQNYMDDPNAPGGTPIMQQSAPKAKIQRRRLLDNRLTDAHGNRIELDKNRDDDRGDNSPRDTHGGLDGETHDKPPFEAYSGQGLHSAFPSEIPPPVLMPVPGAGPLGPFVPAPPEVAMRMLTDPGGPSSFDSIGGPHGRKGRLGPQLGGPAAPILTMPPLFRHDPRRMRSYRDLDAPDDEVTVLDYRSL